MSEALDPGKEARTAGGIPVVPAFDGYRAIAIILVVIYHVGLVNGTLVAAGDSAAAVALYGGTAQMPLTMLFIISGFVLFLPTVARRGEFGRVDSFAIRRFARILPAYWLALAIAVVVLLLIPAVGPLPSLGDVALHVTMLQAPATLFDPGFVLGFGVIAAVWTLSTETAYYLILPLIAKAYYRRPFTGLACAAGLLLLWRLVATNIGEIGDALGINVSAAAQGRFDSFYASQFPSWGLSIAAGMTGAWAFVKLRERYEPALLARRAALLALAAGAATVVAVAFAGSEAVHDEDVLIGLFARESPFVAVLLPLVLAATMVALAMSPRRAQAPFAAGPLRAMGDISYSVYLIHLAVLVVIASEFGLPFGGSLGNLLFWSAITLTISFAYAYLSSTVLERPVRRWARRVSIRRARSVDPPHGAGATRTASRPASLAEPNPDLPAVSIVIPTYNRADWLAGALESCLTQEYGNLEVLVVDDGSSDGTASLLAEYSRIWPDHRFRFIRQDNSGQAMALNRGNAEARGEILGYLSDDDELLPGAVGKLAAELIEDPAAAIAYPAYREINGEGKVTNTVRPITYDSLTALRLHDTVIGPGGLVRRAALERAGGWDPNLRWLGDLVLWIGAGLAGRAVRVDEPLALWRRHEGSATVQLSAEHAREHLRCVEIASRLDGLRPLSRADHAEALRNACMFAALFGGGGPADWPGDRFIAFDLHRRRTSAATSRLGPDGEIDWAKAERAAELYRELVEAAVDPKASAGSGGLERALERLRVTGAMPGPGEPPEPSGDLTLALVEAAFACGADIDHSRARFVICDLEIAPIGAVQRAEVDRVGFVASVEELEAAVARCRAAAAQR